MYWSLGETLPHEWLASIWVLLVCGPRLKVHDPTQHLATEPERARLLKLLADPALESDLAKSVMTLGPESLIRRYLPPGCYADLYHLYVSYQTAGGLDIASPTTFYRVLQDSGWRKILRFRPSSQHSTCPICDQEKAKLRHAKDVTTHAQAADRLMRHLMGQFQDRSVYWQARTRAKRDRDCMTVIADGMDKSKFQLPRYQNRRTPKDLEGLIRPSCEVYAALVHGRIMYVAIADEGEAGGSALALEVISRALDLAYAQAQKTQSSWPSILRIFGDNTPKEICSVLP